MITTTHKKLLWLLAPLAWGAFTWFMVFGAGNALIPQIAVRFQLNLLIRITLAFAFIALTLGASLNRARAHYQATLFGRSIPLPPWHFLVALVVAGTLGSFLYVPIKAYPIVSSLVLGMLISSSIEEFITHGFFIQYRFSKTEFYLFNFLSAVSFLAMHLGYCNPISFSNLMHPTHTLILPLARFMFPLLFGAIAYKTQRIESAVIIHMAVNLIYTITKLILHVPEAYDAYMICAQLSVIALIAWGAGNNHKKTAQLFAQDTLQ